ACGKSTCGKSTKFRYLKLQKMISLKITRQYLEDLCRFFLPYMVQVLESKKLTAADTEWYIPSLVALSVLEDMVTMFQRKTLTVQQKFTIKLKIHEAIILMKLMMEFPLDESQFWRQNL